MPTLVVRKSDGTEQEVELARELIIGRAEGSGLVLTEGGVSRKHAKLTVGAGGQVTVEDLGSSNGSFINGAKIAGPTVLPGKAELVIGAYTLLVKAPPAPKRPSGPRPSQVGGAAARPAGAPAPNAGAPAPRSTKMIAKVDMPPRATAPRPAAPKRPAQPSAEVVLRGEGAFAGKVFTLSGKMVVGRVAGVEIQVEDDSVSRRHAEVEATAAGVVVRDLGSANGTQVNGEPVQGDVPLTNGDSVMFGVAEFIFESTAAEEAPAAPARPGPSSRPIPSRRGVDANRVAAAAAATDGEGVEPEGLDPKKKKLILAGGAAAALIVVFGLAAALKPAGPEVVQPEGNGGPALPDETEIPNLLAEARSFASFQNTEPNWEKAEQAVNRVLDIDPIHPEANTLRRKILMEKEVASNIAAAEKALVRLREEDALELFMKVPSDSGYYPRLKPKALSLGDAVKRAAGEDCKRYVRDGFNQQALPRCEKYATIACQRMTHAELYPTIGSTMCLTGRCKKDDWKPKDESYGRFLTIRNKLKPDAQQWQCPKIDILRPSVKPPIVSQESGLEIALKKRFATKLLADPVLDYQKGKAPEATHALQKLRENGGQAQHHAVADQLLRDISNAEQLFKVASSHLQLEDPEKAADPLEEGLQYDERVMLQETLESYPSFFRENAVKEMARVSYARGVHWMDRSDVFKACKFWKLGFKFYRGNPDLNRAIGNVCTQKANQAFQTAQDCGGLEKALLLAVDGDGIREKAEATKAEWKCQ